MAKRDETWKWEKAQRAYEFLRARAASGDDFSLQDLMDASGWTEENARTNISKQLKRVLIRDKAGRYRVERRFLRLGLEAFKDPFRQAHSFFASYTQVSYPDVLVYEFFVPLAHETTLRAALDDLFYRDTVRSRLMAIGVAELAERFGRQAGEADDELLERVASFVGDVFGGYSISHVNGRFRASGLVDQAAAMRRRQDGDPYLVDETTAVVRFILPCAASRQSADAREPALALDTSEHQSAVLDAEVCRMRWVFHRVFVEAIIEVMTKEDEVWLLESGRSSALWVWERQSG